MTKEELEPIAKFVIEHDLYVLSDEIYSELTYKTEHVSIASLPGMKERTLVINGFSKAFAMTGWRLGYAAGPKPVIDAMLKIHQYTMLCAPIMSQKAGEEALRTEMMKDYYQVREMVRNYNRRRVYVVQRFREMGFSCFEPRGAFYAFPNISWTGLTSEEFCRRLILEHHVACVPGTAFGASGEGFIRCSYATSMDNLQEAMQRIRDFIGTL